MDRPICSNHSTFASGLASGFGEVVFIPYYIVESTNFDKLQLQLQNQLIQNRPISGVAALSTLTVSREKSVRVQSVWRDAGVRDGLNKKILKSPPYNEGRTLLVLAGTLNANRGWKAASFVKTCNVLKVIWWGWWW